MAHIAISATTPEPPATSTTGDSPRQTKRRERTAQFDLVALDEHVVEALVLV